jgi:hypothetical protein
MSMTAFQEVTFPSRFTTQLVTNVEGSAYVLSVKDN